MKIAIVVPFGVHQVESTGLYLIAHYLQSLFPDVVQLRCNGSFQACDRDERSDWKRTVTSCMECMQEQKLLSDWANIPHVKMTSLIDVEEIRKISEWTSRLHPEHLVHAQYEQQGLFSEYCQGTFTRRFGVDFPEVTDKEQEQYLRVLLRSSAISYIISKRFVASYSPDMSFVCGSGDFITRTYLHMLKAAGKKAVIGTWKPHENALVISHPEHERTHSCGLVFDSLASMRPDVSTWPQELLASVEEVLTFAGLTDAQLSLPIAR